MASVYYIKPHRYGTFTSLYKVLLDSAGMRMLITSAWPHVLLNHEFITATVPYCQSNFAIFSWLPFSRWLERGMSPSLTFPTSFRSGWEKKVNSCGPAWTLLRALRLPDEVWAQHASEETDWTKIVLFQTGQLTSLLYSVFLLISLSKVGGGWGHVTLL